MDLGEGLGGERRRDETTFGRVLSSLDAFPKTLEDFKQRSTQGGWASVVIGAVIFVLFMSELVLFIKHEEVTTMEVDQELGGQLSIFLDVDFPEMPCSSLGIDAVDASGNIQLEIEHNVYKTPIQTHYRKSGKLKAHRAHQMHKMLPEGLPDDYCGSCYSAVGSYRDCCNTCADVRQAYREIGLPLPPLDHIEQCVREGDSNTDPAADVGGCNISGIIRVAKVAGTFHISPGHTFAYHGMAVHDMSVFFSGKGVNLTHTLNRFSFGTPSDPVIYEDPTPGLPQKSDRGIRKPANKSKNVKWNYETKDPLNGVKKIATGMGQYLYFLQVVPTTLRKGFHTVNFEQYAATQIYHEMAEDQMMGLPGLYFRYDMSPIRVDVTYERPNLFHFFVRTSAIVGGVFATAKLIAKLTAEVSDALGPGRKGL